MRARRFVIGPYPMKKCARRFSSSGGSDVPVTISNGARAAKHRGLGRAAAHDCVVRLVAVDLEIKGPPDIDASACAPRTVRGGGSRSRPRWPGFGGEGWEHARERSDAGRGAPGRSITAGA